MAHRVLWMAAGLVAFLALVAGCVQVDVPEGPYVVAGGESKTQPTRAQRDRVEQMDESRLEQEVLSLTAENDRLRQENQALKRKVDQLEDRIEDLREKLED